MLAARIDSMNGKEPAFKKFWRKHFGLPSVIDLGWNEYNALEMADFTDEPKGKTWEDYYAYMKETYPVRYFFNETLPKFLTRKIWWNFSIPAEKLRYFLVSHLIPSRRYHMLDLRQEGGYRYGWNDVPEKMLYAMFNLLGEYLSKEEPNDLTQWYTQEQIDADAGYTAQQNDILEARAIHHWWTVQRKEDAKEKDRLLTLWSSARKAKDPKKEEYWTQMRKMDEDAETKTDEMIARLMKIRRTLWT